MHAMKRHGFDPLSFLLGVVFVLVGVTFTFGGGITQVKPSEFWPAIFVVAGLTLAGWVLAATLRGKPAAEAAQLPDEASRATEPFPVDLQEGPRP